MEEPMMSFPVTCPQCGTEALGEYPVAEVAVALMTQRNGLRLHAPCHNSDWLATAIELQQIREYLGAPWWDPSTVPRLAPAPRR